MLCYTAVHCRDTHISSVLLKDTLADVSNISEPDAPITERLFWGERFLKSCSDGGCARLNRDLELTMFTLLNIDMQVSF